MSIRDFFTQTPTTPTSGLVGPKKKTPDVPVMDVKLSRLVFFHHTVTPTPPPPHPPPPVALDDDAAPCPGRNASPTAPAKPPCDTLPVVKGKPVIEGKRAARKDDDDDALPSSSEEEEENDKLTNVSIVVRGQPLNAVSSSTKIVARRACFACGSWVCMGGCEHTVLRKETTTTTTTACVTTRRA